MRHQGFERIFHPLCALPKRGQIAVLALGAKHRHRLAQITMVTAQLALILVPHHFGRTIGAIKGVSTSRACQHRRKTTPIQIHQRHAALLPVFQQSLLHRLTHAFFQRQLAHINDVNFRQHRLRIGALRQAQQCKAACRRIVPAFQAGRGTAQHNRTSRLFGAPQRHIAGMVAQFVLLLKRAIVLLIHHNQAQIGHGCEHAQTRADDELGLAFHRAHKIMAARTHCRLAVQYSRLVAKKTAVDAGEQLRREVDFRQEHQDLLPVRQHLGHGGKIHLGFATAGDAMQKKGLKPTQFRHDGRLCVLLLRIEHKIAVKTNMAGLGADV